MARIALTHRTGRCSNSCAFSQRIHRKSNEIAAFHGYTSQCRHTHGASHTTCLVLAACKNSGVRTSHSCFTRTAEVTICIISDDCPIALDSYRMSTRSTVYRDPTAARGTSKTDCGWVGGGGGGGGWQPKSPTTASSRGNQPAGSNPESNRGCPGPRDIKRDGHNRLGTSVKPALSMSDRAKVQSQPRSRPHWGNGRSRAQWKFSSTTSVTFAGHKTRTAEVTICIISERLLNRPRQLPPASWILQLGDSRYHVQEQYVGHGNTHNVRKRA